MIEMIKIMFESGKTSLTYYCDVGVNTVESGMFFSLVVGGDTSDFDKEQYDWIPEYFMTEAIYASPIGYTGALSNQFAYTNALRIAPLIESYGYRIDYATQTLGTHPTLDGEYKQLYKTVLVIRSGDLREKMVFALFSDERELAFRDSIMPIPAVLLNLALQTVKLKKYIQSADNSIGDNESKLFSSSEYWERISGKSIIPNKGIRKKEINMPERGLVKDNSVPTPSVARNVHYLAYGTPNGEFPPNAHRAAIITEVHPTDIRKIKACVLNPTGIFFSDWLEQDETKSKSGSWHWPEYVPNTVLPPEEDDGPWEIEI